MRGKKRKAADKLPEFIKQIRQLAERIPPPHAGRRILAVWDPENVHASPALVHSLLAAIQHALPQIRVDTVSVVSDLTQIPLETRQGRLDFRAGATDGPGSHITLGAAAGPNAADRRIYLEVAKWVRLNGPPAAILLISKDGDFGPLMLKVSMQGYSTINLTLSSEDAAEILSNRVVFAKRSWDKLNSSNPRRFHDPPLSRPYLIPSQPRQFRRPRTLFILDLDKFPIPSTFDQDDVFDHFYKLAKRELNNFSHHPDIRSQDFLVYGRNLPPLDDRNVNMTYIQTSTHPSSKLIHMENLIFSEFVDLAGLFQPTANAIIMATTSSAYDEFLDWLSSIEFSVFLFRP